MRSFTANQSVRLYSNRMLVPEWKNKKNKPTNTLWIQVATTAVTASITWWHRCQLYREITVSPTVFSSTIVTYHISSATKTSCTATNSCTVIADIHGGIRCCLSTD